MMLEGFIVFNNLKVPAVVALTETEQMQGLMFVEPPFPCMIFPYKSPRINKFWMNNVRAPLEILFCNNGRIINICNAKEYSLDLVGNEELSDCVIELPVGSCKDFDLKVGDQLIIETPEPLI